MSNLCPICHKDDRIKSVSAIAAGIIIEDISERFRGHTTDGEYVTGRQEVSRESRTVLQAALKMPDAPKQPRGAGQLGGLGAGAVALISVAVGFGLLCITIAAVFGVALLFGSHLQIESIGGRALIWGAVALMAIPMGTPLLVFYIAWRRDQKVRYPREWAAYLANYRRWQDAKMCWDRLYYCERDDIVFDPQTAECCKPPDFGNFLYRTPGSQPS